MIKKIFKVTLFIIARRLTFFIKNIFKKKVYKSSHEVKKYSDLLKNNGVVIIENYLDKKSCESIINVIESYYSKNKELIWHDKFNSEYRLHGAEKIDEEINNFFSNNLLINIGSLCAKISLLNLMTMANKVEYNQNNLGSGGGWHRDDYNFQFKAILYLNDVTSDNGPFQFIKNSNRLFNIVKDTALASLDIKSTRIDSEKVDLLNSKRLKTIIGKAGTLILVDTSLIHRGKPLINGKRYAITNYYYPHYKIDSMQNHFLPKIK